MSDSRITETPRLQLESLSANGFGLAGLMGNDSDNFLQSGYWAAHKAEFGWKPYRIYWSGVGGQRLYLSVLCRRLARGYSFAYVPHGPDEELLKSLGEVDTEQQGTKLATLAKSIARLLPERLVFVRYDLPWIIETKMSIASEGDSDGDAEDRVEVPVRTVRQSLDLSPLIRAESDVQVPDTVLLDISLSEEELLSRMRSKTRYNVRLAAKKGVIIESVGPEQIGTWYEIYRETARRDRIAIHSKDYYERLYSENPDRMELLLARHEGELLAGIFVLYSGRRATYLYGASSDRKRNLMPAYAIQWEAILRAKKRGCQSYDFFGIPPSASPDHPMHGLFQFKTGFGGRIVSYAGAWDAAVSPFLYRAYRIAERLRNFYFKKLRKRGR